MKKITFSASVLLLLLYFNYESFAFDTKGIQPVQPYGTFSALSAYTSGMNRSGAMFTIERSVEPNFSRLTLDASYGIKENIDLLANIPLVFDYSGAEGIEDISFAYKHNFLKEKRLGPSMSYILGFSFPGRDGISTDGHIGGGMIISKRIGPFQGHGNLLYYKSTDSSLDDELEFRVGFDLAAAHNFNILSELIYKNSHFSGNDDLIEGRLGYRVKIYSGLYATIGGGYDFRNRNPELRMFFSLSMLHPGGERKTGRSYSEERL
jgi:hypothetical protein